MTIVVLLILCLYFWYLYFCNSKLFKNPTKYYHPDNLENVALDQAGKKPYMFIIKFDPSTSNISITTTRNQWKFRLEDDYYFANGKIHLKDECFEKPDDFKLEAKGKSLYNFIKQENLSNDPGGFFKTNTDYILQKNHAFYFRCKNGKIFDLHTCPPGSTFNISHCIAVNPCIGKSDYSIFPDLQNRNFYYECKNGRPIHSKCAEKTYFFHDTCRSKENLTVLCEFQKDGHIVNINSQTFIKCHQNTPEIEHCPPDTKHDGHGNCNSNLCHKQLDGSKQPLPKIRDGSFIYSPGYAICEGGYVLEEIKCPLQWDEYNSKGEYLLNLPMVYDFRSQMCSIPIFCENVQGVSLDITVPAFEYQKHLKNWGRSHLFDNAIAYRCDPMRKRIALNSGYHIHDYKIRSACERGKKIVIGDAIDRYYDCSLKLVVYCPQETFFDGKECRKKIPNAFQFRNMDIFKMDPLSNLNNWILPRFGESSETISKCDEKQEKYISGYNVCAHPECVAYPFLKQIKMSSIYLPNSPHRCTFKDGKIQKKYIPRKRGFGLKFWSQRVVKTTSKDYLIPETCYPGQKIQSGHFIADSILYMTCDLKQPFVLCPSSFTKGIEKTVLGYYACVPEDRVYERIIPANRIITLSLKEISRIIPSDQARYRINGEESVYNISTHPEGILISTNEEDFKQLWSEKDMKIVFKLLATNPSSAYLENQILKALPLNQHFIFNGSIKTENPVKFENYFISDSVADLDTKNF